MDDRHADAFSAFGGDGAGRTPAWIAFPISMLRRDFDAYCDDELKKIGLKRGHLHFVLFIGQHPGCTQKDLTSLLAIDAGHSARYIAQLSKEGFIEQRRNDSDGRSRMLYLTERGSDAFRRSREILDEWDAFATADLSPSEREEAKRLLRRMLATRAKARFADARSTDMVERMRIWKSARDESVKDD